MTTATTETKTQIMCPCCRRVFNARFQKGEPRVPRHHEKKPAQGWRGTRCIGSGGMGHVREQDARFPMSEWGRDLSLIHI